MAIFSGSMMDDMFMGGMEDDILWGGMGDDTLNGGGGDDRHIGGPGADKMNGGPGMDIASYTDSPSGVHVDMRTDFVDRDDERDAIRGGDAEGDELASIEILWGSEFGDVLYGTHAHNKLYGRGGSDDLHGERGNDLLRGGDDDDRLWGGDGNDTLYGDMGVDALNGDAGDDMLYGGMDEDILSGGDGDDMLEGGPGGDALDGGGEGPKGDTAAYTMSPEAVTIDLKLGTVSGGDAMDDTLTEIENLRGSMYDDMLTGDNRGAAGETDDPDTKTDETKPSNSNMLFGNMGDDMLKGMGGNDTLHGGKGMDTLYGGDGNDKLMGEIGDDALKGEDGADTLAGGPGADKLFGGEFDTETETPGTDDQMNGAVNARGTITMGDTADYSKSDAGVTIDLDKMVGGMVMGEGGDAEDDSLVGIENLMGSMDDDMLSGSDAAANVLKGMDGDDTLRGRDGDDFLDGGKGDDMLSGGAGNDTLTGGSGDDMLNGGTGMDNMDGGAGDDTFVYAGMTIDDAPSLTDDASTTDVNEELAPTDDTDTTHLDESKVLRVDTTTGDKMVDGGGGMDTVDASEAAFTFLSTGAVNANPATGADGVYINLNVQRETKAGVAGVTDDPSTQNEDESVTEVKAEYAPVYTSIEKVIGGDGNDKLIGNARGATTLDGGAGNDTLIGGAGSDMLKGGSGNDMLMGGAGSDTFVYGSGADAISDFQISVRGGATDKIDITALDLSPTQLGGILGRAEQGTYDAGAGTFTPGTGATDGDTRLTFSTGNTLVLVGIDNQGAEALEVGDFML